jgi:chemotaxis protein methyltransferase CheR
MTEATAAPAAMFGDPTLLLAVRRDVVPFLRTYPSINVWVPGCGTGASAYALAILFREEGLHGRVTIYATDVDEVALLQARRGNYTLAELEEAAPRYREAGGSSSLSEYYEAVGHRAIVRPLLRERVTFLQHDLLTDASFNEFHLIVGGEALRGLTSPRRERALELTHQSLVRLGVLALAPGESLRLHPRKALYQPVDGSARLYRRAL